ncbi:MAG: PocR ligand-binding domain-containing protein [bacterium]
MSGKVQVTFSDLAESKEFMEFFNIVSALTGINIALVDPEQPTWDKVKLLHQRSSENRLCQFVQTKVEGRKACERCDLEHVLDASCLKKGFFYRCHAGLTDLVVPICIDGRHIATMSAGQVLTEPPSEKGFKRFLEQNQKYDLDRDTAREFYFQCPWLPEERLQQVLNLLSFFANYFVEIGEKLKKVALDTKRSSVYRAIDYMEENFRESLTLGEVARNAFLSPAYFSHVFRQSTSTCFAHYLQQIRIREAKRLLRQTDRTVTEIAFDSGFNNLSHFNRVFRKLENSSPTQYRNQRRDEAMPPLTNASSQ